jgi:ABC-2 type transport system ATP-binding protein
MEEAQELSDSIIIIDRGKVIAAGTHQELVKIVGSLDRVTAEITGDPVRAAESWRQISGVQDAHAEDNRVVIFTGNSDALLPSLFAEARKESIHVKSVDIMEPNLEAVFLHLTGRALRD